MERRRNCLRQIKNFFRQITIYILIARLLPKISISYRSTYCNQRLKHLLSSLFASTFASRAVSSTDNKLQQSDNLDFKTLPFLTIQLVPIPRPPTAHKALDTSVFAQKGSPQTLHSSIPPGSSCREFSPPLRPPAGLQDGWGWGDLLPLVVMVVGLLLVLML